MAEQKKLTTYPQMLPGEKGDNWRVVNDGIEQMFLQTDLEGKVLVIPGGAGTVERNARLKELAKARWSPPQRMGTLARKADVSPEALTAAEEFRLAFNIERTSRAIFAGQYAKGTVGMEEIQRFVNAVEPDNPQTARMVPMAMAATGKTEAARRLLLGLQERARAAKALRGTVAEVKARGWEHLVQIAEGIEAKGSSTMLSQLRTPHASFTRSVKFAKILLEEQQKAEQGAEGCRDEVAQARGKQIGQQEAKQLAKTPKHQIGKNDGLEGFGELSVRVPPMLMPVKAKNKIARHRVTEEGILPFQLYRLTVDGKIFLDPRKQKGGTVLVDISGSMGLSPDDVYEFVLKCPGATVAQYSGSGRKGTLVVVAHKGRIAQRALIGQGHGGNVVDGPSLEWLAAQPRPRVWVSDTQVTGIHDQISSGRLREQCLAFCQRNQIKIVTEFDAGEVTKALHTSHRKLLAKARREKVYEG